jgi:hypothetical protein
MATETLYVGPLSNATDTDPAAAYSGVPSSPTIVGPEPILSDGSNATYAEMVDTFTISGSLVRTETRIDFAKGKLDLLSVDSSRATLNSIEIVTSGAGTTWNTTSAPSVSVDLYDPTSWDSYWGWRALWQDAGRVGPSNAGDITYLPGDWGSTFRHPETGSNFTAAEVLDFLASGAAYIRAQTVGTTTTAPGSYSATARFYEFKVIVDYTPIGSPAPLRLYPRSSTRLYPRRRTRRPGTF